jgi:hypothetical protein
MKQIAVLFTVSFLGAALAGAATTSAADAAFLQQLARQPPAQPQPPELPAPGAPGMVPKECSVSRDCGDGNTAACVGDYSCQYTYRGVRCDNGGEIACPNFCEARISCCGTWTVCASTSGDCQYTGDGGISCNGYTSYCEIPPWGCGPPQN